MWKQILAQLIIDWIVEWMIKDSDQAHKLIRDMAQATNFNAVQDVIESYEAKQAIVEGLDGLLK